MILLKDKKRCPHCKARRSFITGHCANCGMMIFVRPINFKQFEDDGNDRRYWLWTNYRGWIHRDFVMKPEAQPLSAEVDLTMPEPNTKTVEERLLENRRSTNEQIRMHTPRRNQFGYGKSITKLI